MRAFARRSPLAASLALLEICGATPALAGNQCACLPPAPNGPGDKYPIETPDGTRCRQSINPDGACLDFGASGYAGKPSEPGQVAIISDQRDQKGLVYLRVTMPLGRKPNRLDCSRLYEMEIARLQRELEQARIAAE